MSLVYIIIAFACILYIDRILRGRVANRYFRTFISSIIFVVVAPIIVIAASALWTLFIGGGSVANGGPEAGRLAANLVTCAFWSMLIAMIVNVFRRDARIEVNND